VIGKRFFSSSIVLMPHSSPMPRRLPFTAEYNAPFLLANESVERRSFLSLS
jgi:hypothetical protein